MSTSTSDDTAGETRASDLSRALAETQGGRRTLRAIVVVAILVAIGVAVWKYRQLHPTARPPRFLTEEATMGDVVETVRSTGTVQPVTLVQVGAQVSGRILRRNADFNSQVKKGDLLAELDPTLFQSNVNADAARVQTARAAIEGDRSSLSVAKSTHERSVLLHGQGLLGEADLIQAKGALEAAVARLHSSEASLALSLASLKTSQTNLAYTKIYAPIDGVVISRSIDVGQTVAASFQAPVLFTIAQDLKNMLVLADIDEADLGRLSRGGTPGVDVQVEAFPGDLFPGRLSEVRYNSTSTQGVVTYPAVIEVANTDLKLRPGMTATVSIRTSVLKHALRIPNAALRFHPNPPLGPDGKPRPVRPEAPPPKGQGRVYLPPVDPKGDPTVQLVDVGISDGLFTVVSGEKLKVGTKVIVDESDESQEKKTRGLF